MKIIPSSGRKCRPLYFGTWSKYMVTNAISTIPGNSMNISAHLAPRYEALFRVSDCLRAHQDIDGLFRVLPLQLHPVLDFNYMSVFLKTGSEDRASWFVPDTTIIRH